MKAAVMEAAGATGANPDFFKGTAVEAEVNELRLSWRGPT